MRSIPRVCGLMGAAALTVVGLGSCNQYELYRLSGYTQESFSNRADILFVVDNSSSMTEEAVDLANNFTQFIQEFTEDDVSSAGGGLDAAVSTYVAYVQDRSSFVNYQFAITTTDVEADAGRLFGEVPIVEKGSPDLSQDFVNNLLCEATCIPQSEAANFPDYPHTCGDPLAPGDDVGTSYLDCECGANQWVGNCASGGREEPLEAVFLAMCRAVENPPDACSDGQSPFTTGDIETNAGMLRENSTIIPVIITDEGDQSRRFDTADTTAEIYTDLYRQFFRRMTPVVIGPIYDKEFGDFRCPTGAGNVGALRLESLVDTYDGLLINIADPDNGCATTDFAEALDQIGELLKSLISAFPLQSVPRVDTIIAFVDGQEVLPAEETFVGDEVSYSDGWSYRPSDNAVVFHGSAKPEPNADVEIYYQPIDGVPRDLPF